MESLYGVMGMMVVIALIAAAFLAAPRRKHAWQSPRPRAPEEPEEKKP